MLHLAGLPLLGAQASGVQPLIGPLDLQVTAGHLSSCMEHTQKDQFMQKGLSTTLGPLSIN